nr:MAG TPA: hypothetical protein [Caudoviricetes sp.]
MTYGLDIIASISRFSCINKPFYRLQISYNFFHKYLIKNLKSKLDKY